MLSVSMGWLGTGCNDVQRGGGGEPPAKGNDEGTNHDPETGTLCLECFEDLFLDLPSSGHVAFDLAPGPKTPRGQEVLVAFGVTVPPDGVDEVSELVITDADGNELASHVEETARWRSPANPAEQGSLRAAAVWLRAEFAGDAPVPLQLHWGVERARELGAQGAPIETWLSVSDSDYAGALVEPAAYALFPSGWLSATLLRTRTINSGQDAAWDWFDSPFVNYARTAVNDVPPEVTAKIDYQTVDEPWLYDRASTLFNVYARTGELQWLRRAHRAARFYASHVNASGYFDLKAYEDLKYSYSQSLVIDQILTGSTDLTPVIESVASAGLAWKDVYTTASNFWTERHQTYALLAALSAWEATGDPHHAMRAKQIVDGSLAQVVDPFGSWVSDGCILHTMTDHEGGGGEVPACSTWMSALLSEAVWRYYLQARDETSLELLARLAEFIVDHGTYDASDQNLDLIVPWYLSSRSTQFSDSGPWGDLEHGCDVAGLVARGAWARAELGGDPARFAPTLDAMLETCEFSLELWHRPAGPASGLAEWRLSPPRKFSWWFGTTQDLSWFAQSLGGVTSQ
jgi:hypothetical protein